MPASKLHAKTSNVRANRFFALDFACFLTCTSQTSIAPSVPSQTRATTRPSSPRFHSACSPCTALRSGAAAPCSARWIRTCTVTGSNDNSTVTNRTPIAHARRRRAVAVEPFVARGVDVIAARCEAAGSSTHRHIRHLRPRIPTPVTAKPSSSPLRPSLSSPSSNARSYSHPPCRQLIASSVLKVLVYLYRTVIYIVEGRYRAKMVRTAASATSSAAAITPMSLPPMSGSRAPAVVVEDSDDGFIANVPSTATAASDMKYCRGSGICVADASDQSSSFPLVEDDDSSATAKDDSNHISTAHAPLECAPDEEQTIEEVGDEEDEDRWMLDEVKRKMCKMQLGQRDPSPMPVPAPALDDGQVPPRPILPSPPPLSPKPMSVSKSARQRRAVLPTSYMTAFLLMNHCMMPAHMEFGNVF
ncbi:hypothetical protein CVT25_008849 [Psilocybe cyanescens]|uniref:Uncharacterized protein n=1 Tax=Psilocybe cyanescens TaxID=93625 RepID=A0A409XAV8_PSICY|nr:hypothetical protein CVT25_008849 [Psilocybe cyanescens]